MLPHERRGMIGPERLQTSAERSVIALIACFVAGGKGGCWRGRALRRLKLQHTLSLKLTLGLARLLLRAARQPEDYGLAALERKGTLSG